MGLKQGCNFRASGGASGFRERARCACMLGVLSLTPSAYLSVSVCLEREGGHCRSQSPQGSICLPGPQLPHLTKKHQYGLAGSPLSSFQLRGTLALGASWEQGAEGLRAGWV